MSGRSNGNGNGYDPDNDFANVAAWEAERLEGIEQRRQPRRDATRRKAPAAAGDVATLPVGELLDGLTELLGIDALGLDVTEVQVFGRGRDARVDIHLSDGVRPLRFDSFADIGKPTTLTAELVTQLGVIRTFKGPEALGVSAMVFRVAQHYSEADEDEFAHEWGSEYLRLAPTQDFDNSDQADRWRAFSALAKLSPVRAAGDDRSSAGLAQMSLVLVDGETGRRFVRAGWFQDYVKREVGGLYSPRALVTQMQRVGWIRPGIQGRIKATSPTGGSPLAWSFYIIDAGWERGEVTAGYSPTRAHACARGISSTPAVTRNPADDGHAAAEEES